MRRMFDQGLTSFWAVECFPRWTAVAAHPSLPTHPAPCLQLHPKAHPHPHPPHTRRQVDKVKEATRLVKEQRPDLFVEGEPDGQGGMQGAQPRRMQGRMQGRRQGRRQRASPAAGPGAARSING